jgi:hypothetical protein
VKRAATAVRKGAKKAAPAVKKTTKRAKQVGVALEKIGEIIETGAGILDQALSKRAPAKKKPAR